MQKSLVKSPSIFIFSTGYLLGPGRIWGRMKALASFVCIALLVKLATANSVESLHEEVDEEVPFLLDDAQYLPVTDGESVKGDMSTERSPRVIGLLLRLLRLGRRPGRRPGRGRPRCPTIRFPCSRMRNVCANIRNAFRMGKPKQLQRTTNRSQIRRNRRQSGCGGLGRRTGYNCDEYPFASTFQGGRGAVVRLVPIRENSIQGGMLAAFYRRNRIGHGGCFRVRV